MKKIVLILISLLIPLGSFAKVYTFNLSEAIQYAFLNSNEIKEKKTDIKSSEGLQQWARGLSFPKLTMLSYFTFDAARTSTSYTDYSRDWSSWGPYFHIEGLFIQPIFTWGMISEANKAVDNLVKIKKQEQRLAKLKLAQEIKTYYYGYLYIQRMKQVLAFGKSNLSSALKEAKTEFNKASGKVTRADLSKLQLADLELKKYENMANDNETLAMEVLKLKLGLKKGDTLIIREKFIALDDTKLKKLDYYISLAFKNRPEWKQLQHGIVALDSLAKVEVAKMKPVIGLGANFDLNWHSKSIAPDNGYLDDWPNRKSFGAALALSWNFDFVSQRGKIKEKKWQVESLKHKRDFIKAGIPLQVKKAYLEVKSAKKNVNRLYKARVIARKWMVFGATGFSTGTVTAKDLLEGLLAYIMKKKDYYEAVMNYNLKIAVLGTAVGVELSKTLQYSE